MSAPPPLAIVVLAGGRATRMGGGDKPLRELAGRPILARVLARIADPDRAIVLNANDDPARFAPFHLPVVADADDSRSGPLAGILAGMDWASSIGAHDLVSVPGDCPFLPRDLVPRLIAAREAAGSAYACAASGGWTHPVIGLWPLAARAELRAALAAGERKIDRFTARAGCATAEWPIEPFDPFFNINTPEELAKAETLLPLAERAGLA